MVVFYSCESAARPLEKPRKGVIGIMSHARQLKTNRVYPIVFIINCQFIKKMFTAA